MDNNDAYAVEDEMGVGDYATPEEAVSAEYEYYVQGHNPDAEGFNPTEMARKASHASIERLMRHSGHGASYDPAHLLRPSELFDSMMKGSEAGQDVSWGFYSRAATAWCVDMVSQYEKTKDTEPDKAQKVMDDLLTETFSVEQKLKDAGPDIGGYQPYFMDKGRVFSVHPMVYCPAMYERMYDCGIDRRSDNIYYKAMAMSRREAGLGNHVSQFMGPEAIVSNFKTYANNGAVWGLDQMRGVDAYVKDSLGNLPFPDMTDNGIGKKLMDAAASLYEEGPYDLFTDESKPLLHKSGFEQYVREHVKEYDNPMYPERHQGVSAMYGAVRFYDYGEPDSDVPDAIKFDATRHPIGSEGEIVPDKQAEAQQDVREHAGSAVSVRESEARGDVDVSGLKENGGNDSVEFGQ